MTPNEANAAFEVLTDVMKLLEAKQLKMEEKILESHADHNPPAEWAETIAAGIYMELATDVEVMSREYADKALGMDKRC